jgi:hypothetical protein
MRRFLAFAVFALLALAAPGRAQSAKVLLTWTASPSDCQSNCSGSTGPTLINVYRATATGASCAGLTWTEIATGQPAGGPYTDTTVTYGQYYCYLVVAYFVSSPNVTSAASNEAIVLAALKPAAPTGAKATEQ